VGRQGPLSYAVERERRAARFRVVVILRGRQYVTRSGRSRQQGRNDRFWLVPETERESALLQKLTKDEREFTGSIDTPNKLKELEATGRSIDPGLRRRIEKVLPR
jgi:hypothetical protein